MSETTTLSPARKLLAVLMAIVLAVGLMPMPRGVAWADPAATTATVTISDLVYGQTPSPTTTTDPVSSGAVTYQYSTSADKDFSNDVPKTPGDYYVKATVAATDDNAQAVSEAKKFSIGKAPLKLQANAEVTYGDAAPQASAYRVVAAGGTAFAGEETASNLSGEAAVACDYEQFSPVKEGGYATTLSDLTSDNYDITFVAGALTVNQKTVGFTWAEVPTLTYNGSDQTYGGVLQVTGKVNNDTVTATVDGLTKKDAGDYTAEVTGLSNDNYKLPDSDKTKAWSIAKKPVTITWTNTELTYNGQAQAPTAMAATGIAGEAVGVEVTVEGEHTAASDEQYTATAASLKDGTGKASNYSIPDDESATTKFTIKAATAKNDVTLAQKGWEYGDTPPAPTVSATYGEPAVKYYTKSQAGEATEIEVSAETAPGTYYAKATVAEDDSYPAGESKEVSFEVTKAPLKLKAVGEVTYGGEPLAAGAYSIVADEATPFKGEETAESVFEGQTASVVCAYEKGNPVVEGGYKATLSGLKSDNYAIEFVDGALTVNPIELTITGVDVEEDRVYDGGTSVKVSGGTLSEDVLEADQGKVLVDDSNAAGSVESPDAGENLAVTVTGYALKGEASGNYALAKQPEGAEVTIAAKEITALKWDDELTYTATEQAPTATVPAAQLVDGDKVNVEVTATGQKNVGEYKTTSAAVDNTNYALNEELAGEHDWEITAAKLKVTVVDMAVEAADEPQQPEFTVMYDGFLGEDGADAEGVFTDQSELAFECDYPETKADPGKYKVEASGLEAVNYDIEYVPGWLTVSENPVHNVLPDQSGFKNGGVIPSAMSAAEGDTVTFAVEPDEGYELATLTVNGESIKDTLAYEMGDSDAVVKATFKKKSYSVGIAEGIANGTLSVDKETASIGDEIAVTVTPRAGYELAASGVVVNGGAVEVEEAGQDADGDFTFAMPAGDVVVSAEFDAIDYTIDLPAAENGNKVAAKVGDGDFSEVDITDAHVGDVVTLKHTEAENYRFDSWTVKRTTSETAVPVSDAGTFTMPPEGVTVTAKFVATEPTSIETDDGAADIEVVADSGVTVGGATDPDAKEVTVTTSAGKEATIEAGGENGTKITISDGDVAVIAKDGSQVKVTKAAGGAVFYTPEDEAPAAIVTWPKDIATATTADGETVAASAVTAIVAKEDAEEAEAGSSHTFEVNAFKGAEALQGVSFGDKKITVQFPKPDDVADISDWKLTYKPDNAAERSEDVTIWLSEDDKYIVFSTTHLSTWVLEKQEDPTPVVPGGGSATTTKYAVVVSSAQNGTVVADKVTAAAGDTVTVTATPAAGYELDAIAVTTSAGNQVLVDSGRFRMPADNVTVSATFKASTTPTPTPTPEPGADPVKVAAPTAKAGLVYTGKAQTGVAAGAGYTVTGGSATAAGDHVATATLLSGYAWADGTTAPKAVAWSIAKAVNTLKVAKATRTAKGVSKAKKAVAGLKVKAAGQGKVTFAKVKVNKNAKKFAVNAKTGKITVKKGTKKGTYKVTVSAKAAGNGNYEASSALQAVVTVKVKK